MKRKVFTTIMTSICFFISIAPASMIQRSGPSERYFNCDSAQCQGALTIHDYREGFFGLDYYCRVCGSCAFAD